jgi:catechol 2,3-dioxygenase-like lactoylglutathione lyase family enzyme
MQFQRFEHINLNCNDIDASQQFYQVIFPDWYVRAQGKSPDGQRWRHFGNNQFYLALNDATMHERHHYPYQDIGINHVGFVIEDGDQIKTLLEKNGIEYYTYESPETAHRIYVNDPDGNEIEFVEYHKDYALR